VVVSKELAHLHESVRELAHGNNSTRIRHIRSERWITYARAEEALLQLHDLLTFPKRTRMPNLLLVGPTNNGKTMILEKFRRSHPATAASATEHGAANVPVLMVQMPAAPDEARFFSAILKALNLPDMLPARAPKRQDAAVRVLDETAVRLLIIDEVHNILAGSRLHQRRLLNLLRWLGNELQIPLVAAGTAEALHAVQSDDQLANRFEPLILPRWTDGAQYRQLLGTLEVLLPLRRPSHLAKPALARKILASAEGVLGEVLTIVTRAATRAIATGVEAITVEVVDETGFIPPSQRRRMAV
jgi:Bacterial TniB protein